MANRPARAGLMLALAAAASAYAAPKAPPPPAGELRLDMDDPVIALKIGDVPLRLRVALEQKKLIELNPDAVARIEASPPSAKFHFESGFDAEVGRETLPGIAASAPIEINKRKMLATLSSHGRDCCQGVDGEIGVSLLPYATVRLERPSSGDDDRSVDFLIDDSDEHGPQANIPIGRGEIAVQFSLHRPDSVATSSAGAMLARAYGGRRLPGGGTTVAAFGMERPTIQLAFARSIAIAGFAFDRLPVRIADFAGNIDFPDDPEEPGEIVVKKKIAQQRAWPVVMIGRDRLDRCSAAIYDTIARRLTLRCAFESTP